MLLWKRIGIDLGTSTMVVYVKGDGVVLNEPALLAAENGGRVVAFGSAARELLERRSGPVRALRPVRDGVVTDYRAAGLILQHFIARVCGRQRIFRPDVMLAVPSAVTGVERRAVLDATMTAGVRTAYLIEKPMAAALGANLPTATAPGIAVCHLGAGSTEVAVIAAGEVVALETLRLGGVRLDAAIGDHVRERHGVTIDEQQAERLKIAIGSAIAPLKNGSHAATGTDASGRPVTIAVSAEEVYQATAGLVEAQVAAVERVWSQTPDPVRAAVRTRGLTLTGGGALLRGLVGLLSNRTGLMVTVAPQPQACAAVGAGLALENLQILKGGQHYIA